MTATLPPRGRQYKTISTTSPFSRTAWRYYGVIYQGPPRFFR